MAPRINSLVNSGHCQEFPYQAKWFVFRRSRIPSISFPFIRIEYLFEYVSKSQCKITIETSKSKSTSHKQTLTWNLNKIKPRTANCKPLTHTARRTSTLQVARCKLQTANCKMQTAICNLQDIETFLNHKLNIWVNVELNIYTKTAHTLHHNLPNPLRVAPWHKYDW